MAKKGGKSNMKKKASPVGKKGDFSITIDSKNYSIPKAVWDLLVMISKERDYYLDIVKKLEAEHQVNVLN
jgi:hypothetical protein